VAIVGNDSFGDRPSGGVVGLSPDWDETEEVMDAARGRRRRLRSPLPSRSCRRLCWSGRVALLLGMLIGCVAGEEVWSVEEEIELLSTLVEFMLDGWGGEDVEVREKEQF
jgi:hypothetical protein